MNQQEIKIDANKVINNLTQQIALLSKEMAVLQVTNDDLRGLNGKQSDLIKAYEDKENAE